MSTKMLKERYGYIEVFSIPLGKTILRAQRLLTDPKYVERHGLILLAPPPEQPKQNNNGIE